MPKLEVYFLKQKVCTQSGKAVGGLILNSKKNKLKAPRLAIKQQVLIASTFRSFGWKFTFFVFWYWDFPILWSKMNIIFGGCRIVEIWLDSRMFRHRHLVHRNFCMSIWNHRDDCLWPWPAWFKRISRVVVVVMNFHWNRNRKCSEQWNEGIDGHNRSQVWADFRL